MEEKQSYSPEEVAQICGAYKSIYGAGSTTSAKLSAYEQLVPKNVQEAIRERHRRIDSLRTDGGGIPTEFCRDGSDLELMLWVAHD